jgi:type II secretory pathway pseudopilin PulG
MKVPMAHLRTSASDAGFAMVEAVVSAAVLAIVALAVLSGIDGASDASGAEKARTAAYTLAEQDQERLHEMSYESLTTATGSQSVPLDGVNYTVASTVQLITDDTGGTPSCGSSTTRTQYAHITSTVTSNIVGVRTPVVKVDSLMYPSVVFNEAHGTLGVKVGDRNAAGVPGITVNATSPGYTPTPAVTDANGCVLFGSIPIGTYTITLNTSGYVDTTGSAATTASQTVSPNTVNFATITYDRAASASIAVKTHQPGQAAPVKTAYTGALASHAVAISDNSSVPGTLRTITNPSATASAVTASSLFPFATTQYGFFTGSCASTNPSLPANAGTSYFSATNPLAQLTALPAGVLQPVTVFQPPFNVRVNYSPTTLKVYASLNPASGDSCPAMQTVEMSLLPWPYASPTIPTGAGGTTNFLSQKGTSSFDPGMPFGIYTICIANTATTPPKVSKTQYANTTIAGPSSTTVIAPTFVTGTC